MIRLFCAAALVLASSVLAPASAAQTVEQTAERYWIVVGTDGGAEVAPTDRAIARRALRASTEAPTRPDRGVNPAALAALRAAGVVPVHTSRWLGAVSADLTPEQAEVVGALPAVREVRRTARLVSQGAASLAPYATARPLVFIDYGVSGPQMRFVRADEAVTAGRTGAGVLFGILDTLFDFAHPALRHIPDSGRLAGQRNFIGGQQSDYHGLATSSIALGNRDGVLVGPAHGARVLAATTEFAPTETHAEEDAFVAGLEWMESQGADVVSVSLGYSVFDAPEVSYRYQDMNGNTAIVTRAADMAVSLGVVVVVSAGNEGGSAWRYITAPGDGDDVITVGAATSTRTRAGFSSVGPTFDGRIKPDVAALGVGVYVAQPSGGVAPGNGTSYSAPMVAGVAAQMLGARPTMTPVQVRDALRRTASRAANPTNDLGWGIIDAVAALAVATASDSAPVGASAWRLAPTVARPGGVLTLTSGAEPGGEPVSVDVLDALGRRVATWSLTGRAEASVVVPALSPGAYFARVPGAPALRFTVVR